MRMIRHSLFTVVVLLILISSWAGLTLTLGPVHASKAGAAPPRIDLSTVIGDRTLNVSVSSGDRTALVHHPDSVGAGAPLVLVLHGESGSAEQARDDYGWNALADREGFVVAYPESDGNTWNLSPTCCGQAHTDRANDVGYLHQLVSAIGKADLIARNRVYAVGFSDGATLAYTWACSLPDELAGIGTVAGSLVIDCPIVAPVSLAVVHGGADRAVPVGGGPSPSGLRRPLEDAVARFRALDRCPELPASMTEPPVAQRSRNCVAEREVSVAIIDDAGHQWPGADAPGSESSEAVPAADPPPPGLNATEWLWAHLRNTRSR